MSKFKIGDWVQFIDSDSTKYFGRCLDIRDTYHSDYGDITVVDVDWTDIGHFIQDVEPWQPQEGEWCWYKHMLVKVISVDKRDDGIIRYVVSASMYAEQYSGAISLEPFIGTLPTFSQGK